MSGGCWDYRDRALVAEIFGYNIDAGCGLNGETHDECVRLVVKANPLRDQEISALVFDLFCLLHSFDYAESGDRDLEDYRNDINTFKKRWFSTPRNEQIKIMIDLCTDNLRQDLYEAFLIES